MPSAAASPAPPPLAALPMYDFPEIREATDALWSAIAAHLAGAGIDAPAALTRGMPLETLWTHPSLLLAQTCGYPLVTTLRDRVTLLATPRYTASGCKAATYRSAIIVRAGDPATTLADLHGRGGTMNGADSNSGMNLLRAAIAPLARRAQFFAQTLTTGSHAASVQAVANGEADVAAIDCITWAHLQHLRPQTTKALRVLAWTEATPGLPLITSLATPAPTRQALLSALNHVSQNPSLAPVRAALRLDGFEILPLDAYDEILALERQAIAAGYPNVR